MLSRLLKNSLLGQLDPFFAAPLAAFHAHELARLHVEAPLDGDLPFVKPRTAQGLACGAFLPGFLQVDDVGHGQCVMAYVTMFTPSMYARVEKVSKYHSP